MIESVVNNILTHTRAHFPEEACGLVAIRKGKTKFYPCENKAADPLIDFSIDPKEYRKVSKEADIIGIIHNHPPLTSCPNCSKKLHRSHREITQKLQEIFLVCKIKRLKCKSCLFEGVSMGTFKK